MLIKPGIRSIFEHQSISCCMLAQNCCMQVVTLYLYLKHHSWELQLQLSSSVTVLFVIEATACALSIENSMFSISTYNLRLHFTALF